MVNYSNLVSESVLVAETVKLLKISGGSVGVEEVARTIFNMPNVPLALALALVGDLVSTDPRLNLLETTATVELVSTNFDKLKLAETDYVVFDFETTGAKCPPCRVTEIGAYRVEKGKIVGEFQTLVNPECEISFFIRQLTGISDEMVKNAPKFREVIGAFLEFIGDAVLVAHNAHFDMRFLNYEIGMIYENYRVHNPHLCTVQLARKLLPNLENHKLNTVAEHYAVSLENHHRASDDAHATAKIFVNFLEMLEEKGVKNLGAAQKFKR